MLKLSAFTVIDSFFQLGGVDLHTKYHFISLSNKYDRLTSTPNISTKDFIQNELSIGYTELITQQRHSPKRNTDNTNGNNKLNLWPEPTSSFINNINRSNDKNNNDTFLNLKLPLTPIVNKAKQSSKQNLKLKKCTMNIQTLRNQKEIHYKTPFTFRWTPISDTNEQQSPKTPLLQTSILDYVRIKCKVSIVSHYSMMNFNSFKSHTCCTSEKLSVLSS